MNARTLVAREARIRLARRGMNQTDLARALGVSSSTVSLWIAGERAVTRERQRQLVEILGGSARTLFVRASENGGA
jgi:transcriptional regulator with XRE-family HTH domain